MEILITDQPIQPTSTMHMMFICTTVRHTRYLKLASKKDLILVMDLPFICRHNKTIKEKDAVLVLIIISG